MTADTLKTAEEEVRRFLQRIKKLRIALAAREAEAASADLRHVEIYTGFNYHPAETGAVRRASLDLTRALAKLRRHDW